VTIHAGDPFATPDDEKSPVRRLRGRLPAAVTLWTAYGADGRPAGLTVSSTVIADGDPGRVLGIVDEESDFYPAVRASGRFVLCVLRTSDRRIADNFAGIVPIPGGPFQDGWIETAYGPLRAGAYTWAGCRLDDAIPLGYGELLIATIDSVQLGGVEPPLIHYRGRYATGPDGGHGLNG
jgi:3-hydroxy-9,10-secoandrosta-1,3,5(10)-triene-9,17-dione monooxygenase reductase component